MIGAKQKEKSDKVFSQTIVTAAIVCVLISFLVFALFQPPWLLVADWQSLSSECFHAVPQHASRCCPLAEHSGEYISQEAMPQQHCRRIGRDQIAYWQWRWCMGVSDHQPGTLIQPDSLVKKGRKITFTDW
ncbi:MAG: hypothetical protein ACLTJ5_06325 [Clostridium sp.]